VSVAPRISGQGASVFGVVTDPDGVPVALWTIAPFTFVQTQFPVTIVSMAE
jgi:hypothetical protein